MRMSESIKEIAPALIAAQKEFVPLKRDKTNPFYKSSYIGLETVMPEALRVLNGHDLAIMQTVGNADGGSMLSTTLLHSSGEWISDTQPLLLTKEDPQAQGSAITYARRYGLMAMLGIVAEEDDDANRTVGAPPARTASRKKPQGKPLATATADAYEGKARELEQGESAAAARTEPTQEPQEPAGGGVLMPLKYAGNCLGCGQPIAQHTNAYYSREKSGVWHERCDHLMQRDAVKQEPLPVGDTGPDHE